MVSDNDVITWYDETFNKPGLFFKERWPVTLDTSLSAGDYVWASETGADIMDAYFATFNVDCTNFDFYKYWSIETLILYAVFTCSRDDDGSRPLTLRMPAEPAKAGEWLYDWALLMDAIYPTYHFQKKPPIG